MSAVQSALDQIPQALGGGFGVGVQGVGQHLLVLYLTVGAESLQSQVVVADGAQLRTNPDLALSAGHGHHGWQEHLGLGGGGEGDGAAALAHQLEIHAPVAPLQRAGQGLALSGPVGCVLAQDREQVARDLQGLVPAGDADAVGVLLLDAHPHPLAVPSGLHQQIQRLIGTALVVKGIPLGKHAVALIKVNCTELLSCAFHGLLLFRMLSSRR